MQNYTDDVLRTNSPQWHGDKMDITQFEDALIDVIRACQRLDAIKKFLFAGKGDFKPYCGNCHFIPPLFAAQQAGIDIVHSIIGMATEAGELVELLYGVIQGKEFDVVNFKEEMGDSNWYQIVGLNAVESNYDEVMQRVIAKLRARYKDRFTSEECITRNLNSERKALESEP